MKVAAANGLFFIQDYWVVRDGIQFGFGEFLQVKPCIARGPVNLRDTPKGIGVLDPFAVDVTLQDL